MSATSARIRTTTTCDERTRPQHSLLDVTPGIPQPGVTSPIRRHTDMTDLSAQTKPADMTMHGHSPGVILRSLVIGLTAFLTVVDLFATQAILPSLTRHYGVTPAAMGF